MRLPRCDIQQFVKGFYCQCIGCEIIANGGACILVEESSGVYRHDGNTPHGGSYAYLYFTDNAGNLIDKEKASYVEIREMDRDGNVLHVDFGIVDDWGFTLKRP